MNANDTSRAAVLSVVNLNLATLAPSALFDVAHGSANSAALAYREICKRGESCVRAFAAYLTDCAKAGGAAEESARVTYAGFWRSAQQVNSEFRLSTFKHENGKRVFACVAASDVKPSNRAGKRGARDADDKRDATSKADLRATLAAVKRERDTLAAKLAAMTAERDALAAKLAALSTVPAVRRVRARAA